MSKRILIGFMTLIFGLAGASSLLARPKDCPVAKPGCGMKCHGDDKLNKCPGYQAPQEQQEEKTDE